MIALAYNLVRLVMPRAAQTQHVPGDRVSFIDALRWLCHTRDGDLLCQLVLPTHLPGRHSPASSSVAPNNIPS